MKLTLPELGEDVEEATVLRLLVSEGDEVENEQSILEVETDKASLEVPASSAGVIEKFSVAEGDTVKVGQELAELKEKKAEGEEEKGKESSEGGEDSAEADDAEKKSTSEGGDEKEKDGDDEKEEVEAEDEDSKQEEADDSKDEEDSDPESKSKKEEKEVETEADSSERREEEKESSSSEDEDSTRPSLPVFASPSVRAFAREIGVDLVHVEGTAPGGRISKSDVSRAAREQRSEKGGGAGGSGGTWPPGPLPDFSRWGETDRVSLSGIRKATADSMSRAWANVPHVTLFEKVDVTALEEARERFRESVETASGAKLTVTAMLLKIVATVIGRHPKIAVSFDPKRGEVVRKSYVHLGVAVDTEKGLVVPVLRDADRLGLAELAKELGELAAKARDGTLQREDMQGGVLTLTNLGGLGTGFFTPIVNHPEGAILGVGRAETEPVYDSESETFLPRQRLPLSLSFDHRLIDGADGARFLHALVQAIEDPIRLALEVPGGGGKGAD